MVEVPAYVTRHNYDLNVKRATQCQGPRVNLKTRSDKMIDLIVRFISFYTNINSWMFIAFYSRPFKKIYKNNFIFLKYCHSYLLSFIDSCKKYFNTNKIYLEMVKFKDKYISSFFLL